MLKEKYILFNGTVIDGYGGEPARRCAVAVNNGRIGYVGKEEGLAGFTGYEKVDMGGGYLMPGLIDAHVHLGGMGGDAVTAWTIHPTIRLLKTISEAQSVLSYGFTSVRDVGSPGAVYLKRLVEIGEIAGPRIVACGRLLSRRGGHSDIHELPFQYVEDTHYWGTYADTEDEIRKAIRMILREGADQIKFLCNGGGNNLVDRIRDQHYSLREIKVMVEEARKIKGTRIAAHAMYEEAVGDCIEAGVDSIEHGYGLTEKQAEDMAEKGIFYVPTLYLLINWYEEIIRVISGEASPGVKYGPFFHRDILNAQPPDIQKEIDLFIDSFRLAKAKGVKIAAGSDTVNEAITKYGKYGVMELKTMVRCGMTPLEAITAGTKTAAEVLALDAGIGTIEAGKIADLLILRKNPAEDIDVLTDKNNISHIIQRGKLTVEDGKLDLDLYY